MAATRSAAETAYAFKDQNPLNGINFYRLKTVDLKKEFTYTKIIGVKMNVPSHSLQVFPNPASGSITVQVPVQGEEALIRITDMSGRVIQSVKAATINHLQQQTLNISRLPTGRYLLSVNQSSVPFIKQ